MGWRPAAPVGYCDMVTNGVMGCYGEPSAACCRIAIGAPLMRTIVMLTCKDLAMTTAATTFVDELRSHGDRWTARNRDPILSVLREELPPTGQVLEVGSGSGEHLVHFAPAFPALRFVPSDPSTEARASVAAWAAHERLDNVERPIVVDLLDE